MQCKYWVCSIIENFFLNFVYFLDVWKIFIRTDILIFLCLSKIIIIP